MSVTAVAIALCAVLVTDGSVVQPNGSGVCPPSHPIKGVFNPRTRECTYHPPGGPHYERMKPDVCFATEDAARQDDCWKAGEVL